MNEEFTFEEKEEIDDHSSQDSGQESNTWKEEEAPQDYIVCLKEDVKEKAGLPKISWLINKFRGCR